MAKILISRIKETDQGFGVENTIANIRCVKCEPTILSIHGWFGIQHGLAKKQQKNCSGWPSL